MVSNVYRVSEGYPLAFLVGRLLFLAQVNEYLSSHDRKSPEGSLSGASTY